MPSVPRLADVVKAAVASWPIAARVVTEPGEKDAAFRLARAALTKSGTSTLELAVAGVPMVAAYKVPLLEDWSPAGWSRSETSFWPIWSLARTWCRKLCSGTCTPERLAAALVPLLADTPERRSQIEAFARLDTIMEIGRAAPSDRAAAVVLDCAGALSQPERETVASGPPTA